MPENEQKPDMAEAVAAAQHALSLAAISLAGPDPEDVRDYIRAAIEALTDSLER